MGKKWKKKGTNYNTGRDRGRFSSNSLRLPHSRYKSPPAHSQSAGGGTSRAPLSNTHRTLPPRPPSPSHLPACPPTPPCHPPMGPPADPAPPDSRSAESIEQAKARIQGLVSGPGEMRWQRPLPFLPIELLVIIAINAIWSDYATVIDKKTARALELVSHQWRAILRRGDVRFVRWSGGASLLIPPPFGPEGKHHADCIETYHDLLKNTREPSELHRLYFDVSSQPSSDEHMRKTWDFLTTLDSTRYELSLYSSSSTTMTSSLYGLHHNYNMSSLTAKGVQLDGDWSATPTTTSTLDSVLSHFSFCPRLRFLSLDNIRTSGAVISERTSWALPNLSELRLRYMPALAAKNIFLRLDLPKVEVIDVYHVEAFDLPYDFKRGEPPKGSLARVTRFRWFFSNGRSFKSAKLVSGLTSCMGQLLSLTVHRARFDSPFLAPLISSWCRNIKEVSLTACDLDSFAEDSELHLRSWNCKQRLQSLSLRDCGFGGWTPHASGARLHVCFPYTTIDISYVGGNNVQRTLIYGEKDSPFYTFYDNKPLAPADFFQCDKKPAVCA